MRNKFLVLVLALCSLAGSASAQIYAPPARRGDLASAAQRVAQQAAAEAPQSRFARAAQELAQLASMWRGYGHRPDQSARLEQSYTQARRMLAAERRFGPSDALLDAWDDVVIAYAPMRRAAPPAPSPYPMPTPTPTPAPAVYRFDGRFESMPVRLTGRTLDELDRACLEFTRAIDTRNVDDVYVGQRLVRNGPSYWDAQALCSIAVLNATLERAYAPARANGAIEGIPFSIEGTPEAIRAALEQHVPRIVRQMQVDEVEINGQGYRNGPSYWTAPQIVALIASQLSPGTWPGAPLAYSTH